MVRRRLSEAETLYQRALTILIVRLGPNAASFAGVLSNRAVLSVRLGRLPDALTDLILHARRKFTKRLRGCIIRTWCGH